MLFGQLLEGDLVREADVVHEYVHTTESLFRPAHEFARGGKIGKIARDKYGVWLAGGQGAVKGKIFRFGHCGYFGHSDITVGLSTVEMVLAELGYDVKFGASVGAAEQVFMTSTVLL